MEYDFWKLSTSAKSLIENKDMCVFALCPLQRPLHTPRLSPPRNNLPPMPRTPPPHLPPIAPTPHSHPSTPTLREDLHASTHASTRPRMPPRVHACLHASTHASKNDTIVYLDVEK
ncbi:hypothetical protein DXG01_001924 [Tephrocybe rancida]|nr:hypothetical protein DXG01_001924 [Tephrocybe rancida]